MTKEKERSDMEQAFPRLYDDSCFLYSSEEGVEVAGVSSSEDIGNVGEDALKAASHVVDEPLECLSGVLETIGHPE